MDLRPSLMSYREAAAAVQPGDGALHHGAMPAQAGCGFVARARQAWTDVAAAQGGAIGPRVVGLVRVRFGGTGTELAPFAADGRHPGDHSG